MRWRFPLFAQTLSEAFWNERQLQPFTTQRFPSTLTTTI
jgi:hypothetical protein